MIAKLLSSTFSSQFLSGLSLGKWSVALAFSVLTSCSWAPIEPVINRDQQADDAAILKERYAQFTGIYEGVLDESEGDGTLSPHSQLYIDSVELNDGTFHQNGSRRRRPVLIARFQLQDSSDAVNRLILMGDVNEYGEITLRSHSPSLSSLKREWIVGLGLSPELTVEEFGFGASNGIRAQAPLHVQGQAEIGQAEIGKLSLAVESVAGKNGKFRGLRKSGLR